MIGTLFVVMTASMRVERPRVVVLPRVAGCAGRGTTERPSTPTVVRRGLRDPTGAYEARLVREDHQLRAIAQAELRHRPAHVGLRGQGAHEQPGRDLVVREAGRDQADHLAFTFGQALEPGFRSGRR